jgi:hypothetical protein
MRTLAYLLAACGQAFFLYYAARLWRRDRNSYLALLLMNLVALVYDSLAVAVGPVLGEGPLLRALSAPRFWAHALLSPLLVIFAFGVARRAGISWAQSRGAHAAACLFALALLVMGAQTDVLALDLQPKIDGETLRYVNVAHKGPPIPVILVNVFALVTGVSLGRATGDWRMLGGAALMFALAPQSPRLPALGNLAELAFSYAMISGEQLARKAEATRLALKKGETR